MDKKQKLILLITGVVMFLVIGLVGYNLLMPKPEIQPDDIDVSEKTQIEETIPEKKENKAKEYVNIYFIGKNSNNEEVYKAVKREYNKDIDGSKIKFALYSLFRGPKNDEKQYGVYSEIPLDAEIINISENPDRIIININTAYVTGGGADSLYKRLYQLIKTVKLNTSIPAYLYINGQKADVVGGEGIMISQPLSDSSLDN